MAYTTINKSSEHFNTKLYTGNGVGGTNITGVGFKPDLVWIKRRSGTENHVLNDSLRGAPNNIYSSATNAQDSGNLMSAILSDGFTVQTDNSVNSNTDTYASWNWLAGGSAPTQTYTVKVVSDGGNKYRFDDFGTSAVTLDLQEGGTYTFDVSDSSMNSHPFVIGTAANSSEYSTGVTYKLDGVTKTYSQYTSGFSAATTRQLIITVADSAPALYYWCSVHSGMGGAINTNSTHGSSNFSGNIQTLVSANTSSGFSIVKYTGNGSASGTLGHGLGATPAAVITRPLSYSGAWWITNHKMPDSNVLEFNTNAQAAISSFGGGGLKQENFTSTTISGGNGSSNSDLWNKSGDTYIAYCFAQVNGFSKFGTYRGNNNTNGSFIYTGFKPRFVMIKHDGSSNWTINDSTRDTNNPNAARLFPNQTVAESTGSNSMDIYSNGFKLQSTDGGNNGAGENYYYWAFGQSLVGSNNVPATAF
tara:strand:- start:59 stop:1480 length:1422 start_codon:yes stop_codon:yes gene_type:complete